MLLVTGVLLAVLCTVQGLYPSSSDVVTITSSNFNSLVERSDAVWVIEFFAPWCGHCRALVPEYSKAATALKGVVKVGAINCDDEKELAGRFGIRGFPTIKVFGADKSKPTDYNGARSAQAIVDAAMDAARRKVNANLSGKKSGSSGSRSADPKDVVELTDDNFASMVYNSKDYWLVEFFSPGCGHCQRLAPEWAEAATQLKGKARLGAIDATSHHSIPSEFNIRGYPTMYWFEPGAKGKRDAKEYDGGRTSSDIVNWVTDMIMQNAPPPEVVELVDETVFKEQCSTKPLCVMAFLPHILDCQSECRNNYIKMLTKVGEKFKRNMWGWMWLEGGVQTDLEQTLEIGGFGYPAMAALNTKKQKFSLLKRSFSEEGISDFLKELSYGRGKITDVRGTPKVHKTEPWNGQDQALPEEEDIDLSDVVLDDDAKDEL